MKKSTKTALVTGASKGIGRAYAKKLAQKGYNLVLIARSKDKLQEVKKECKTLTNEVIALAVDLTTPHIAQDVFKTLARKKIVVDVLINNAGFGDYGSFSKSKISKQSEMIQLNITCLTEMSYAFLAQASTSKQTHLVNIGSVLSFIPSPFMSVYGATKAFVLSFSEALAAELKGTKTAVTCICPGKTQSEFAKGANMPVFTDAPSAAELVEFAYEAMVEKEVVAVHGGDNRSVLLLPRLLPRSSVRNMMFKRMSGR